MYTNTLTTIYTYTVTASQAAQVPVYTITTTIICTNSLHTSTTITSIYIYTSNYIPATIHTNLHII